MLLLLFCFALAARFIIQSLDANPLDYVEGGAMDARRQQISSLLDSINPDLKAFHRRGGKLITVIGTVTGHGLLIFRFW